MSKPFFGPYCIANSIKIGQWVGKCSKLVGNVWGGMEEFQKNKSNVTNAIPK